MGELGRAKGPASREGEAIFLGRGKAVLIPGQGSQGRWGLGGAWLITGSWGEVECSLAEESWLSPLEKRGG